MDKELKKITVYVDSQCYRYLKLMNLVEGATMRMIIENLIIDEMNRKENLLEVYKKIQFKQYILAYSRGSENVSRFFILVKP